MVVLLAGCGATDTAAESACRHMSNVLADVRDGQLTEVELRGKLQEVERTARGAEDEAVRRHAREMVRVVTGRASGDELVAAVDAFSRACEDGGHLDR